MCHDLHVARSADQPAQDAPFDVVQALTGGDQAFADQLANHIWMLRAWSYGFFAVDCLRAWLSLFRLRLAACHA